MYNAGMVSPTRLLVTALCLVATLCVLVPAWYTPLLGQGIPASEGTWITAAAAPTKRTEVAVTPLGGEIYVIGGFSELSLRTFMNLTVSKVVEEYDPSTDRWTIKAPLPVGLHHAGAAAVGDRLYVIGGFTASLFSIWQPVASV